MDKKKARSKIRTLTAALQTKEQVQLSRRIYENLLTLEELSKAKTVFCFVGIKGEPDTTAIINHLLEQDKIVCVPKCYRDGIMDARKINNLSDLEPVPPFGIPEPGEDMEVIPPQQIDFAIIPGLAFDRTGGRLGKGAGYYDRFLKMTNAYRCAICFEFALIDKVPVADHDIPMDMLVTDSQIIRV